ncbi:MAG TPA: hypothetical protein DCS73_08755 [Roseburia sp.]|nr:hypothetical protein [Roseburia sp.]
MSIRPVDLSGMIQRTQDVGNIKHVEDSRPIVDQYNIEVRQEKQEADLSHKVQDPEQKDNQEFRYDAREKGNNNYNGNGKKKKKHGQPEEDEGSVHMKERRTSFDVKI